MSKKKKSSCLISYWGFDPLDIILPRARCLNAIRDLNKIPFKEPVKESIEENVGRDEEQDPNPTKLP